MEVNETNNTAEEVKEVEMVTKEEYNKVYNQLLLTLADMDNFRKRKIKEDQLNKEKQDLHLIECLSTAFCNLYAMAISSKDEGVKLVYDSFIKGLQTAGISVINPSEGEPFNMDEMFAISTVPANNENESNTIYTTLELGFKTDKHLFKPAKVVVYS